LARISSRQRYISRALRATLIASVLPISSHFLSVIPSSPSHFTHSFLSSSHPRALEDPDMTSKAKPGSDTKAVHGQTTVSHPKDGSSSSSSSSKTTPTARDRLSSLASHLLPQGNTEFDYIIVGGGTAGAVLANRLTQDSDVSVAVIEGGPSDVGLDV
jgi:hypothetical protein